MLYACSCGNINSSPVEDEDQAVSLSSKMKVGCFVVQAKWKETNKTQDERSRRGLSGAIAVMPASL